ncbi:heavy metal translocating P-type ATPase [Streptomyces sp. NPDC050560]|uniref:heavy metal translocating P-type ATPase n=1 Tax=Streptomyces sp. NPDC050560 TaxID=3365630 RepID=UPI0037BE1A95
MSAPDSVARTTDLTVTGMTCAACVGRVEKRLARLDGVTASVNLATGTARVTHPASVTADELVSVVQAAGYGAGLVEPDDAPVPPGDAATPGEMRRLAIVALLALPVLALSMVPSWQFDHWQWLCFVLAAPVATWGAWPFHRRALAGLRHAAATMDTLVSLGVTASLGWSCYALFGTDAGAPGYRMPFSLLPAVHGGTHGYLEAAVSVPLAVLAGRLLEGRARAGAGAALRTLADLTVKEAAVLGADGGERTVPLERLRVGDTFLVRPGERVAADGVVTRGASALDQSLVTGESNPVEVATGSQVVGGAVNAGGPLQVRVTAVAADGQLARITRMVTQAQAQKARVQRLADAVAGVFVPCAVVVAVTVLGFWLGAGAEAQSAVTAAVAILVVACPCALGLATPTALLAATGRGAGLGILVKGARSLETLRAIDTVVLDKTGTLTVGRMAVTRVTIRPRGLAESAVLRLAAAVERGSEHPVGRAVVAHARQTAPDEGPLPEADDFRRLPDGGVAGRVEGHRVEIAAAPGKCGALTGAVKDARAAGHVCVLVRLDGVPEAVVELADSVRSDAYRAVRRLHRLGVATVMATGDDAAPAHAVAGALGITEVHARSTPEDKAALVASLRASGRRVAVLGDGVNDAAALAIADLGIAMGSGTDAAAAAADITLVRADITAVADAVALARRALRTIRANLAWAFAYNAVTLPLAATGWLDPMLAATAMSASSLLVVGNSLRLRAWHPRPGRPASRAGSRRVPAAAARDF